MRGIETTPAETVALFLAIASIIASFAARVQMFRKRQINNELHEFLGDSSMIGSDLLAFRIAFRWRSLKEQSRRDSIIFVALFFAGVLGLLGVVFVAFFRTNTA